MEGRRPEQLWLRVGVNHIQITNNDEKRLKKKDGIGLEKGNEQWYNENRLKEYNIVTR